MIADVVNLAMMTVAFCHAAGRLIFHRGFAAGISAAPTQERTRWESECREPNMSALTRDI
jgi:hypothetical protein